MFNPAAIVGIAFAALLMAPSGKAAPLTVPFDFSQSAIGLDVVAGTESDVIGSVADRAIVERVFGDHGVEAVIHAGALHKPDVARFPAQAFVDVNVATGAPIMIGLMAWSVWYITRSVRRSEEWGWALAEA